MIMEEEKYRKELEDFRNKMHGLMDNMKERELYERVTKPKTKDGSMGAKLNASKDGKSLTIRLDIPETILRKWLGLGEKKHE